METRPVRVQVKGPPVPAARTTGGGGNRGCNGEFFLKVPRRDPHFRPFVPDRCRPVPILRTPVPISCQAVPDVRHAGAIPGQQLAARFRGRTNWSLIVLADPQSYRIYAGLRDDSVRQAIADAGGKEDMGQ